MLSETTYLGSEGNKTEQRKKRIKDVVTISGTLHRQLEGGEDLSELVLTEVGSPSCSTDLGSLSFMKSGKTAHFGS